MRIIFGLLGIVASFAMMKYRERVGDMIGDAEWMQKVGGVYNLVIILGLIGFFWSVAYMTDTLQFLLWPIVSLIPGIQPQTTTPVGL